MEIVERVKSRYNDVDVWKTSFGFDFEVAGGTHATYSSQRILTDYVWDAITAATLLRKKGTPKKLLMLGLGGGTAVRQLKHFSPDMDITAIEIDSQMVDLAKRYMKLNDLDINVKIGDGYAFVRQCGNVFDAVVDDIYLGDSAGVVRPVLYHQTLIQDLCSCLKPDGILVTNMITGAGHQNMHREARKAFEAFFGNVTSVTPWKGFNEALVGGTTAPLERLARFDTALYNPSDKQAWSNINVTRF